MSLDYQFKTYWPDREPTRPRTTYGFMNQWNDVKQTERRLHRRAKSATNHSESLTNHIFTKNLPVATQFMLPEKRFGPIVERPQREKLPLSDSKALDKDNTPKLVPVPTPVEQSTKSTLAVVQGPEQHVPVVPTAVPVNTDLSATPNRVEDMNKPTVEPTESQKLATYTTDAANADTSTSMYPNMGSVKVADQPETRWANVLGIKFHKRGHTARIRPDKPKHERIHSAKTYTEYEKSYMTRQSHVQKAMQFDGPLKDFVEARFDPRLKQGRAGGGWRHVKVVKETKGNLSVYVDGAVRVDDFYKRQMLRPNARCGYAKFVYPALSDLSHTCRPLSRLPASGLPRTLGVHASVT